MGASRNQFGAYPYSLEIVYQGYVGVRKIVKIDSETLSNQEALHLDGLLRTAQFFNLPGMTSSPKFDGCYDCDFPDFRITVEVASKRAHRHHRHTKCRQPSRTYAIAPLARSPSRAPKGVQGRSTDEVSSLKHCSDHI